MVGTKCLLDILKTLQKMDHVLPLKERSINDEFLLHRNRYKIAFFLLCLCVCVAYTCMHVGVYVCMYNGKKESEFASRRTFSDGNETGALLPVTGTCNCQLYKSLSFCPFETEMTKKQTLS